MRTGEFCKGLINLNLDNITKQYYRDEHFVIQFQNCYEGADSFEVKHKKNL